MASEELLKRFLYRLQVEVSGTLLLLLSSKALLCSNSSHFRLLFVDLLSFGFLFILALGLLFAPVGEVTTSV